jgi:hypothetical protein
MGIEHEYMLNTFVSSINKIGWKRIKKQHSSITGITDIIFNKENKVLYTEIKPSISLSDMWSGIGQTLRVLVEPDKNVLSILVCPEEISNIAKEIFNIINSKRIGLISFDKNITNFKIIIPCWKETSNIITAVNEKELLIYERTNRECQVNLLEKIFSIKSKKEELIIDYEELLNIVKEESFIENKKDLVKQLNKFGIHSSIQIIKDSKSGMDIMRRVYRINKKDIYTMLTMIK